MNSYGILPFIDNRSNGFCYKSKGDDVKKKSKVNTLLVSITPPIIFSSIRKLIKTSISTEIWTGDYTSWEDAKINSTGYDSTVILEKCKNSLLKVKNGDCIYERDSVIFDKIQYSWGLLAGLQRAALENNGNLCVLDFGGSLGSTYYQNKEFLSSLNKLSWCIVEQPHFVKCGLENFVNNELKFYYSIEECFAKNDPNVILLSSVLQYLEKPYEWLDRFFNLNIDYIIIDRTAFINSKRDLLTVQKAPNIIYEASYPSWFFGEKMNKKLTEWGRICIEFNNGFTPPTIINGTEDAYWKGVILKK